MLIETQVESMFRRELSNLCLSILLVSRPDALQFLLVNGAVRPSSILQFAFDSRSKNLHNAGQRSGRGIVVRPHRCVNPKKVGLSRFCEGARPLLETLVGQFGTTPPVS